MKLKQKILLGLGLGTFILNLGWIQSVQANENRESRLEHRFGIYTGLLNDPFPTLIGLNLAVNVLSFLRINAGYGSISSSGVSVTSLGGGAKLMIPGTTFTPVLGINYANVNVSTTDPSALPIYGISANTKNTYLNLGFDWQTQAGFNFGVGYNYSLLSGVGGAPYLNLGWFF